MTKGILPEKIDQELMGFYALVIDRVKEAIKRSERRHEKKNHIKPHSYSHNKDGRFKIAYFAKGRLKEWVAYKNMKRWIESDNDLHREGWVAAKRGKEKHNSLRINSIDGVFNPERAHEASDKQDGTFYPYSGPYLQIFMRFYSIAQKYDLPVETIIKFDEVAKETGKTAQNLAENYYYKAEDGKNYFIRYNALSKLTNDPERMSGIDLLLLGFLKPAAGLVIEEIGNNVFVHLQEISNRQYVSNSRAKTFPLSSLDREQRKMVSNVIDLTQETTPHEYSHVATLLNKQ